MKHLKKLGGILLALAMVLALAAPAFASHSTGGEGADTAFTITVKPPTENAESVAGITYSAYKVFDVTYSNSNDEHPDEDGNYAYTINEDFKGFTYDGKSGSDLVALVSKMESDSAALNAFAQAAYKYATGNSIAPAQSGALDKNNGTTLDVSSKGAGYYLIFSQITTNAETPQTISACMLTTTNPNATVNVKAQIPPVGKTADKYTASVGDTIEFTLTSTVPNFGNKTSYWFEFVDTLSDGLTYKEIVSVKIGGTNVDASAYKVTSSADGSKITIRFEDLMAINGITMGAPIEVKYTAVVNEKAFDGKSQGNKVLVNFPTDNGNGETEEKEVPVYVFDIEVDKFEKGDTDKKLAGAVFALKNSEGKYYSVQKNNDGEDTIVWVTSDKPENDPNVTKATTGDDGKLDKKFKGLAAGTYSLEEIAAPSGYNKLTKDLEVVITCSKGDKGTVTVSGSVDGKDVTPNQINQDANSTRFELVAPVENATGTLLPETGGIGTTIFYIVGGVLVVGAVVILIAKRRTSLDEE